MKKVLVMVALVMVSVIVYAFNDRAEAKQGKKEVTGNNGEVVVMNKEMFLKDVFDYEKSKEWKYKGDKPAIIDLYADWCGPCRQTAPIMKELAKEYAGKIVIYKVNVDKQKELAALFNATSIPLFVFIPMKGDPQLFRGCFLGQSLRLAGDFVDIPLVLRHGNHSSLGVQYKHEVRRPPRKAPPRESGPSAHSGGGSGWWVRGSGESGVPRSW